MNRSRSDNSLGQGASNTLADNCLVRERRPEHDVHKRMAENDTLIVVADGSRARAFLVTKEVKRLRPGWSTDLMAANLASREIASDRPGRSFDSVGHGRHAIGPTSDPARYEAEKFARELAGRLDEERKHKKFAHLIIAAPPQMLGDLRKAMSDPLRKLVTLEIDKDISKLRPDDIYKQLKRFI